MARMNEIAVITNDVLSWIREYLPDEKRDPINATIKMQEEACELIHALYTGDGSDAEEMADILLCLVDIAHLRGVDLYQVAMQKMAKNRLRKWTVEKGALKHVK